MATLLITNKRADMDASTAAAKMLSEPDKFFKYYPLFTQGAPGPWNQNAANAKPFFVDKRDAGLAGVIAGKTKVKEGHFGAHRPGFLHTKEISSFYLQPSGNNVPSGGASAALATHGIPMVNYNSTMYGCLDLQGNIVAMPHFVAGAGANYITTGPLSGCCFAWIVRGTDLWCTHVQPKVGITGQVLQQQLGTTGRFAAAPQTSLSTFGRNDYGGNGAIVVGVRSAGNWRLYAQTSLDAFRTINGAYRLYPGRAIL